MKLSEGAENEARTGDNKLKIHCKGLYYVQDLSWKANHTPMTSKVYDKDYLKSKENEDTINEN